MGRILLASLLLAVVSTTAIAADHPERADAYIALVEQYRTGDARSAVKAAAAWTDDELAGVLAALPERLRPYWDFVSQVQQEQPTTLDVARDPKKPTPLQLLATAMVLHAHVARDVEGGEIQRHLDFAVRLFQLGVQMERKGHRLTYLLPDGPERTRFLALWHVLAGTIAMGSIQIDRAADHFAVAQQVRGDDPPVLLAVGSFHEMLASLLGPDQGRPDLKRSKPYAQMTVDAHLRRASDAYERALALDPAPWETRARYARVAHLLGRGGEAQMEIARVLESAPGGNREYLARLIAGTIAQGRGEVDTALAHYRRARYLCDTCQSVTLALSHALLQAGDRAAAIDVVDRLLELASPLHSGDPWWTYHRGQWHGVDALLDQVRKAIPR